MRYNIISLLNPTANIPQGETPLLIAVGAVGKALGITIRPPAKSENSNTLEGIARASGFRTRRVTLTPNWWKTDCGSLLAFTKEENQPVALLKVKATKYEILDPVELTRTPLNRDTAARLAPIAYTFYRPFPDKEITFLDILQFALRGSTADLVKILLVGVVATLFGMFTPQITGILIDYAIPDANRQLLIQMGLGLLAASFGVMIFQLAQTFAILRLETQVSYDTQAAVLLFGLTVALIGQSTGETGLSTGTFLAFDTAFGTFIASATRLSNTLIDILEITILWERAQPILQTKTEVDAQKYHPGRLSGQFKLDSVCFRYRQNSPLVLDGITLEAKPGEFIAIVGLSGSGKSTILRLLLGFETPEAGTISYDRRDLSGLDIAAVRRQLGVVLQNGQIMSGSIWENIAGGAIVSQNQAWEALQMAGLADDIEAMPMGIHTVISEGGGNISGGQRQRLFIARALVNKPQILLFDEATSALDNRTQGIVTQSLEQLGVTRVVIAHRLSTIQNADRIYVMQAGKIVQEGSFEELAAVRGLFADLMARQMT